MTPIAKFTIYYAESVEQMLVYHLDIPHLLLQYRWKLLHVTLGIKMASIRSHTIFPYLLGRLPSFNSSTKLRRQMHARGSNFVLQSSRVFRAGFGHLNPYLRIFPDLRTFLPDFRIFCRTSGLFCRTSDFFAGLKSGLLAKWHGLTCRSVSRPSKIDTP